MGGWGGQTIAVSNKNSWPQRCVAKTFSTCFVSLRRWKTTLLLCSCRVYKTFFYSYRFYRTIVVPTSDKTKKVKVSVVRVKPENTSLAQIEMLEQVFLCPKNENGLSCTYTNYGIAVTVSVDHVKDQLTFIPVPDGEYDCFEEAVTSFATLNKVVFDYNPPPRNSPAAIVEMQSVLDTLQKMNDVISSTFSIPKSPNGGIRGLVSELVTVLQRLQYLSSLCDMADVYSDLIQMAVQKFQTDYNAKCQSAVPQLPSDGLLCRNTWTALQRRLGDLPKAIITLTECM